MPLLPSSPRVVWTHTQCDFRSTAPWGLDRISRRDRIMDKDPYAFTYIFDTRGGRGTNVFIIGAIVIIIFSSLCD